MADTNQLLTINELQEAQYFSDEQKNFLKDYKFSYILRDYNDDSMVTYDDCGHSITKIAVVENNEYGDITDIGTINIATETSCPVTNWTELLGGDMYVSHYISSNISGFPSHCNKTTENIFNDNRKEVFDKLGILDDARKWYDKKCSTENLSQDDGITKYLEDRFNKHIFCDKCKSIIPSSHWKNYGLWRTHEMQGVGEDAVEVEREYFDIECPICKEHKEVDVNGHIELYNDTIADEIIDTNTPDNPFETPDNPFDVPDNPFSTSDNSFIALDNSFETPDEILNKFTDGEVISYAELIRRLPNHFAFREKLLAIPNHMSLSDKYHVVKGDKCIQLDYVGVLEHKILDYVDIKFNEFDIEDIYFCCPEPDDCAD